MPIYMYQCEKCGVRFEKMQRMSADPLTDCPECDGQVHRVIQPVGIIFKGSGFYVTDNRSGKSSTLTAPKETDSAESKKEASTEADAKETSVSKETAD